ncbi:hypothetical protein VTK73DRAFT_9926 [Phialemonium thermophilum]|uniref:Peptidase C45 hydrolase domain-containing protein n=1 Tax=Phialemonium thermophilum TaxID=223376 RepID=A0ABR3VZI0_9PEZI
MRFGWFEEGLRADVIALTEDPRRNYKAMRRVDFVMKDGTIWKQDGRAVGMIEHHHNTDQNASMAADQPNGQGQSHGQSQSQTRGASTVKTIHCSGTPYEIGLVHGREAAPEVRANIAIYTAYFRERASLTWDAARSAAQLYLPTLRQLYPEILDEMTGIAHGVGGDVAMEDILTLNLRSEILLTTYSDGCTCVAQRTARGDMFLGQNWDWIEQLRQSIVFLRVAPRGGDLTMHFMTEAGLVGKIGMNSAGVGLCMNAIRCAAKDVTKLPVHVMMRRVLQFAHSFDEALEILAQPGLASAVNFMIADRSGRFGDVECTPAGNVVIRPQESSPRAGPFVVHTNHLYSDIKDRVRDTPAKHSFARQERMVELTKADGDRGVEASFDSLRARFSDEQGWPFSICRDTPDRGSTSMEIHPTVCCGMMELTSGQARFLIGRPSEDVPVVEFSI